LRTCSPVEPFSSLPRILQVRSSFDTVRLPTSADLHISSSMSVAADVFVPFFFNSPPQLLLVDAPLGNALGEVKIIHNNEFERRARRIDMCVLPGSSCCSILPTLRRNSPRRYERAAAVLPAHASLIGGTVSLLDSVVFRAMCTVQNCTFMTNVAPAPSIDILPISNSSLTFPLSFQLQILQQQIHRIIGSSCLLEPERSCRCCPSSTLPLLSRAVDAMSQTFWISPPLRPDSFFGLDFLMPVRLRRIIVDAGHAFQDALTLEVLHSLSDAWVLLRSKPQVSRVDSSKGGSGSSSSSAQSVDVHEHAVMRFTYNVERGLRDLWRLQVHT
jgi:hypothetical protein